MLIKLNCLGYTKEVLCMAEKLKLIIRYGKKILIKNIKTYLALETSKLLEKF
jgi:hypothetical protein